MPCDVNSTDEISGNASPPEPHYKTSFDTQALHRRRPLLQFLRYSFEISNSIIIMSPPYDEDDEEYSDEENGSDYSTTNVLLGYASKEPTEDEISHLGGIPVCLPPSLFPRP